MKNTIFLIFVLSVNLSFFSQSKEEYRFTFIDLCTNKIVKPEFEIDSFPNTNYKFLLVSIERKKGWIGGLSEIIRNKIDTIYIPKLIFSSGAELHTKRHKYLKCQKIANNIETDFHINGNKRIEGNFVDGKPEEIKEFNKFGKLTSMTLYKLGRFSPIRVNYFDSKEELYEYEIYKYKKRRTITKTYDERGKLISKEIEKY